MSAWQYASTGGTNYPVQPGEVWRADHHVLACGDLEQGDGLRLIERAGRPDLIYCDPPWNPGNAAAFRTKAGMPRRVDFSGFLIRLLTVTRHADRDVFVEMGLQNAGLLVELAEAHGARLIRRWPITVLSPSPVHACSLALARPRE